MDTEHAFSAAIMLLMVCAAFPRDAANEANEASLRAAIALLGNISSRGNDHMGTRYWALLQLAASMVPNLDLGAAAAEASAHISPDASFGLGVSNLGVSDLGEPDLGMPDLGVPTGGFPTTNNGMAGISTGGEQGLWETAENYVLAQFVGEYELGE
jgi:hypothetical protein